MGEGVLKLRSSGSARFCRCSARPRIELIDVLRFLVAVWRADSVAFNDKQTAQRFSRSLNNLRFHASCELRRIPSPDGHNLPLASAKPAFTGRTPMRSAIRTRSANESASILRIMVPLCCFTVFSEALSCSSDLLVQQTHGHKGKYFSLPRR